MEISKDKRNKNSLKALYMHIKWWKSIQNKGGKYYNKQFHIKHAGKGKKKSEIISSYRKVSLLKKVHKWLQGIQIKHTLHKRR